jgi:hypothetical protein
MIAEHHGKRIQIQQRADRQIHETKESFVKIKNVTVSEATYWFHKVIGFHRHVIRLWQEKSYILSQIGNADQTPVFFDMLRNTTVQRKGSSAVLVRTLGLHYNAKTFHLKFINRIPISRPILKVTSKTTPSKNSLHNFRTPLFMRKLAKKCENYASKYGNSHFFVNITFKWVIRQKL